MAVVCSHITPFGATLVATGMLLARKVISGEWHVKTAFVFFQTAAVFFKTAAVFFQTAAVFFKTAAVFFQTAAVFFQTEAVFFKTAAVFFQTEAVFFKTAAVCACSHKSSAKKRPVATDNDLQSSKLNTKVALVARFFSRALYTRARNEQICATGMTPKASSINNRNDRRTCGSYNIAERNLKHCW